MLKQILTAAYVIAAILPAFSQDTTESKKSPNISGYVDVYYRYNLNNPRKELNTYNNFTSFTNSHNSFELGMASVKLDHSFKKISMVADVGLGKRAEEFSYNDENSLFLLKQAFVSYAFSENFKITAGSWATHVGYELVDPHLNRNYSMSYLFSKGPFFHTGVKGEYTIGHSNFMLGVANPSDLKSASGEKKFVIAQYGVTSTNEAIKVYINFQGGNFKNKLRMNQFDATVTGRINSIFSWGYNCTMASLTPKVDGKYDNTSSWWGSAIYLNADPLNWVGFILRGEYFNDEKVLTDVFAGATEGGNVFSATLSSNIKLDNLTIIPELRFDYSNRHIFVQHLGQPTQKSASALLAAIYNF